MKATDCLFFVEDPGAANYVAPLAKASSESGLSVRLMAAGPASDYLRERGAAVEAVSSDAVPQDLLEAIRPRVLVVGTSEDLDALGLRLTEVARQMGVVSVGA